ncbi:hypothetical protein B0H10DRAFT_601946 [Mycena sp. CBHHK59/15]|nr:hypothetical protein B0H10DRAFT_601946 [Mycena sp. CBHHK59/15]
MDDSISALNSIQIVRAGVIAVYCLSIYEWLETLSDEVDLVYPSRWNSVKLAYFLCRYYPLLVWPTVIYAYVENHTAQTCAKLTPAVSYALLPMQSFAQGVMLMRAYAFAGRNVKILFVLCSCYAGLLGVNIWFFCTQVVPLPDETYEILGGTGCFPDYAASGGTLHLIVGMAAAILMDLVSLSIIAIYCLRKRSIQGSLGRTFINQGLFAFGVVIAVQSVSLGTYFNPAGYHNGVGLPYILVIPNLIACRLILDLRRKALPTETQILRRNSLLVDNAFASSDLWTIAEDGWR